MKLKLPQTFRTKKNLENKTEQLIEKPNIIKPIESLEIEPGIRDVNSPRFYFGQSLKRLKESGYERHMRTWEYFGLLVEVLEGKLQGEPEMIAEELMNSTTIWTSLAVKREGDTLTCYIDPEIERPRKDYIFKKNVKPYTEVREFYMPEISSGDLWYHLRQLTDEFVKYIFTRTEKNLPKEALGRSITMQVALPPEGVLWPAACAHNKGQHGFVLDCYGGTYYYGERPSKGVRLKKT